MEDKEKFDILQNSPDTEREVVEKPLLGDKRQVKSHLKFHFPGGKWNSFTVQNMIRHWKKGGIVLRCRNALVDEGVWQCLSVRKVDDGSAKLPASAN